MVDAHPTALIDPSAELAPDVVVGPYTIIEANVRVGSGTWIGHHCTLAANLRVGSRVRIHHYACLGTRSQDLKHRGERSCVEIGDHAIVREFVTVNCGTREGSVTRIGAGAVLMAYVHVAHECSVGEKAILTNAATLGGEVRVGRCAVVGGLVGIHQFCQVGEYAMIGANSKVTQDIAPYLIADGHPARPFGPNLVGLRRNGFSDQQIREIRRIYRELFSRYRNFSENMRAVAEVWHHSPYAAVILDFLRCGSRGVARPRPRRLSPAEFVDYPLAETTTTHE